jgi:hypothetical protein
MRERRKMKNARLIIVTASHENLDVSVYCLWKCACDSQFWIKYDASNLPFCECTLSNDRKAILFVESTEPVNNYADIAAAIRALCDSSSDGPLPRTIIAAHSGTWGEIKGLDKGYYGPVTLLSFTHEPNHPVYEAVRGFIEKPEDASFDNAVKALLTRPSPCERFSARRSEIEQTLNPLTMALSPSGSASFAVERLKHAQDLLHKMSVNWKPLDTELCRLTIGSDSSLHGILEEAKQSPPLQTAPAMTQYLDGLARRLHALFTDDINFKELFGHDGLFDLLSVADILDETCDDTRRLQEKLMQGGESPLNRWWRSVQATLDETTLALTFIRETGESGYDSSRPEYFA